MTDEPKSVHLTEEQLAKILSTLDRVDTEAITRAAAEIKVIVDREESEREIVRLVLTKLVQLGLAAALA